MMELTRRDFFKGSGKAAVVAAVAAGPAVAETAQAEQGATELERLEAKFIKADTAFNEAEIRATAIRNSIPDKYRQSAGVKIDVDGHNSGALTWYRTNATTAGEINRIVDDALAKFETTPDNHLWWSVAWVQPFPKAGISDMQPAKLREWYLEQWETVRRQCLARLKARQDERGQYLNGCGLAEATKHANACHEARWDILEAIEAAKAQGALGQAVKIRVGQLLLDGGDIDTAQRLLASIHA